MAEVVKTAVCAVDGLTPGEDAVGGLGGELERIAGGAGAVFRGDGVGAAEHLFGEGGIVVAEAVHVGAVLSEDLDVTQEISCDYDVAVFVGTAGEVGGRFFWFRGFIEVVCCCRCWWEAGGGRVAVFRGRYRRSMGLCLANKRDRWRIAEVV